MEAVHVMVGVRLYTPEWLKGKKPLKEFKGFEENDPVVGSIRFVATGRVAGVFICPGCNLEWELRIGNKSPTFAEVLRPPVACWVG